MKRLFKPLEDMGDDSVIHIIHSEQDRLETMSDYGYEDLVPLSVADMWQFMPWQGMDSAPSGTHILLMDDKGVSGSGFIYRNDTGLKCSICNFHPIKWLPLPTVDL